MAKLIDILARELKVWPVGAVHAHSSGHLARFSDSSGTIKGIYLDIGQEPEDHMSALVTRAEWQAAVDALNAPKVVEWDGVGLPPVGVKVEVTLEDDGLMPKSLEGWKKGDIVECIAHFSACGDEVSPVFFNKPLFLYSSLRSDCYRPIRTAEQVAAEEREKALKEMRDVFLRGKDHLIRLDDCCARLYDAGYRKQ